MLQNISLVRPHLVLLLFLPFVLLDAGRLRALETEDGEAYPKAPIKVIVPFGAGGGSDTFARIIQKAIQENDLLPQPIVIINVPGAGGTIGSRQAMEAKPDGYTFLCLHEGIMSAKYAGNTEYGPEAFAPVAGTGEVGNVIAVAEDSKYEDLEQLLSDAAERPEEVIFSANIGAPSHFIGLMLENTKMGAKFRYTQTGGGAKRFAALIGGHIDVSAFSMAEYKQFQSAGLKALAYCGESRHPQALEIPTATEQGFDVVTSIMQFWWAPKKTPSEKIKVVAEALRKAMKTPQVQESLKAIHTDAIFLAGQELKNSLQEREQRFANVVQRDLTQLPNFPIIVLGGVLVLALLAGFQAVQNPRRVLI